jgi:hypothetical protein
MSGLFNLRNAALAAVPLALIAGHELGVRRTNEQHARIDESNQLLIAAQTSLNSSLLAEKKLQAEVIKGLMARENGIQNQDDLVQSLDPDLCITQGPSIKLSGKRAAKFFKIAHIPLTVSSKVVINGGRSGDNQLCTSITLIDKKKVETYATWTSGRVELTGANRPDGKLTVLTVVEGGIEKTVDGKQKALRHPAFTASYLSHQAAALNGAAAKVFMALNFK